jgi:superfamily II DNA or RNA helicase
MESVFEAVRKACSATDWSRGVELVRIDAVARESADDDEIVLRVVTRGGMICPRVTLWPDDAEWDCECPSKAPACEHAAAAVIALKQAERQGKKLAGVEHADGKIAYRLERGPGGLELARVVRRGNDWVPLTGTIASAASSSVIPRVAATQADLALELELRGNRGPLPRRLVPKVLAALARCDDVQLDGEPVQVSAEPVMPLVRLVDDGDGFRLFMQDDASVDEHFSNGCARCGEVLRPIGDLNLSGRELHELPRGKRFRLEEATELVTAILPSLTARIPVSVETERLPSTERKPPRVAIDVSRDGDVLHVLPTIVYGDPPRARIDGGRLVHLQGPVPLRDEVEERRLMRRLQRDLGLAPGHRVPFRGEEAVAFATRLERWGEGIRGADHEWFRQAPPLQPRLTVGDGRFDLRFEVEGEAGRGGSGGRGTADPAAVLRAWREGASMVPLLNGGWSPLPADWLGRFGHRVADLLAARDASGEELPRAALADLAHLCEDLEQPAPAEFTRLRTLFEDFSGIPTTALPEDLRAELRPYQKQGIDWLAFLREAGLGALLADDMGLGKTLQALCALRGRTLVVAPTSVLQNWLDEAAAFRPGLRCCRYHGLNRELDPQADLTVTTYAILRLDVDRLAGERFDTVVLDEAQAIKNPESRVAQAAYRLQADFRITLTGTPVENRLEELWSQFHFINPGLLGGRSDFDERYARPIATAEPGVAARLRERIRPFTLRRLKKEVAADLPPRTDVVLHCELTPDEREVYDSVRATTLSEVVAKIGERGNVLAALEALLRLRQASCHPSLVPGQSAEGSSKVALLLESLDTVAAEGHRALVFSQWTSMLDLIEPALGAAGIEFLRLDGSTRDRAGVVRRFQERGGPPVLLISLKAGGTGLNLTAADHVFIVDPWWNPAVEDQAADRAHRIGQDKPVMVYRLVAEDTVEDRILALQQKKREVAEAALGEADAALSITREDLLGLLQ